MFLAVMAAALALAASAQPAKAPLDCVWDALPPARRAAALDLRTLPDLTERMRAAWEILKDGEAEKAAESCGLSPGPVATYFGPVILLLRSAEAELAPRYSRETLAKAFEAARPTLEQALLNPDEAGGGDPDQLKRLAGPFLAALERPPGPDRPALLRYFEARVLASLHSLAMVRMEQDAARERVEMDRQAGDAPFVAQETRPAWEATSRLPCFWREMFSGDDGVLYGPDGILGVMAYPDIFPEAGLLDACEATQADMDRLRPYLGARYAERRLIRRFDAVRLDNAFRILSPADRVRLRQTSLDDPGEASAALVRFRSNLGLGQGDMDDETRAMLDAYAINRARLTD